MFHCALTRGLATLNYSIHLLSPTATDSDNHCSGKISLPKGISEQGQGLCVPQAPLKKGISIRKCPDFHQDPSNGFPRDHCFYQHPCTPQRLSSCPLQRCPHSFPCQQSFPRPSHLRCCQSEKILLLMKNKTFTHGLLSFAEPSSVTKTPS